MYVNHEPCGTQPFLIHSLCAVFPDTEWYANTVRCVLERAANEGMQSLAMPLICNNNSGWPAKLAAEISIAQTLEFFYESSEGVLTSLTVMCYVNKGHHRHKSSAPCSQMTRQAACWLTWKKLLQTARTGDIVFNLCLTDLTVASKFTNFPGLLLTGSEVC